jgi:hypothetical protein
MLTYAVVRQAAQRLCGATYFGLAYPSVIRRLHELAGANSLYLGSIKAVLSSVQAMLRCYYLSSGVSTNSQARTRSIKALLRLY